MLIAWSAIIPSFGNCDALVAAWSASHCHIIRFGSEEQGSKAQRRVMGVLLLGNKRQRGGFKAPASNSSELCPIPIIDNLEAIQVSDRKPHPRIQQVECQGMIF
jgi:hypothetical protein